MTALAWAGMACALAGATLLYLASPNQLAWKRQLPRRALGWTGGVITAASLALLLQWAGPATAVFIVFTLVMLVWSFVAPVAAWLRGDRKAAR